jgi:hypothetical protein
VAIVSTALPWRGAQHLYRDRPAVPFSCGVAADRAETSLGVAGASRILGCDASGPATGAWPGWLALLVDHEVDVVVEIHDRSRRRNHVEVVGTWRYNPDAVARHHRLMAVCLV